MSVCNLIIQLHDTTHQQRLSCHQVVPDDTFEHVTQLLREIWINGRCKHLPAFYSTDNVGKDRYTITDALKDIRSARALLYLSTTPITVVLQDLWHARERVSRELKRGHPDYYQAVAALNYIFGRCSAKWTLVFCTRHLLINVIIMHAMHQ